jgi:nitrate reductase molybdenum cofactor assembly chaperone
MAQVYRALATLLDYPGPALPGALDEAIAALAIVLPEAARLLETFREEAGRLGAARLEEIYTETFDFLADRALYVGHQLFGEDNRRGFFMARLRHRYHELGLPDGREVPDHLSAVLAFLAAEKPGAETRELIEACLVPAVSRILRALKGAEGPYPAALQAVLLVLEHESKQNLESGDDSCKSSSLSSSPTSR